MKNLVGLFAGILFGAGLALSGMTGTQKVIGFLDLFGAWDITLMFVMGGGLLVSFPVYQYMKNKPRPVFDEDLHLPSKTIIDKRLIGGAILFGIGWALYGYCQGSAISSLAYGDMNSIIFVVTMTAGMLLSKLLPTADKA